MGRKLWSSLKKVERVIGHNQSNVAKVPQAYKWSQAMQNIFKIFKNFVSLLSVIYDFFSFCLDYMFFLFKSFIFT